MYIKNTMFQFGTVLKAFSTAIALPKTADTYIYRLTNKNDFHFLT